MTQKNGSLTSLKHVKLHKSQNTNTHFLDFVSEQQQKEPYTLVDLDMGSNKLESHEKDYTKNHQCLSYHYSLFLHRTTTPSGRLFVDLSLYSHVNLS